VRTGGCNFLQGAKPHCPPPAGAGAGRKYEREGQERGKGDLLLRREGEEGKEKKAGRGKKGGEG